MLTAGLALATSLALAPPDPDYADAHRRTQVAGMATLTGWAAANIAVGVPSAFTLRSDARFIHEMNAMWNTVNLTLGIVGLATKSKPDYRRTLRVYAINNAIDVLYISAGILVAELGRQYRRPRVEGWGRSVVLQGAFLFAFDLTMLIAHERVRATRRPRRPQAPSSGLWVP